MEPIFDIEKIRRNRRHALEHMDGHDFLFVKTAERIADNLRDIQRDFNDILIIGSRGSDILKSNLSNYNIEIFDIDDFKDEIPDLKDSQYDCIISMHYMHVVNDVPGFLMHVKKMLKPDGVFLNAFFGGQSLNELRQSIMAAELEATGGASQHIHPMIDHYQAASLMQRAGYALPVVDYDRVIVEYGILSNLYKDLANMGEGNALANRDQTIRPYADKVEETYRQTYFNKGYVATFDIIHCIGWAPHDSQQKPLERGSGEVSLTEILGKE